MTHAKDKTYLAPLPKDIVEVYMRNGGIECPLCFGIHLTKLEYRPGANIIIYKCDDCGLEYAVEHRIVNVYVSQDDLAPLKDVIAPGYTHLDRGIFIKTGRVSSCIPVRKPGEAIAE